MQTFLKGRRVGYWLSEKKMKKLNFQAFADLCRYVHDTQVNSQYIYRHLPLNTLLGILQISKGGECTSAKLKH